MDPHILLRITLFSAAPVVHKAFLAHRPYAALCHNKSVQTELMAAYTKKNDDGNWVLPNRELHSPSNAVPAVTEYERNSWWKNGLKHRDGDLPAVVWSDGDEEWWVNGKRHRENDLPAVCWNTVKEWWKNGRCHRDGDLPAVIKTYPDTVRPRREWLKNGSYHRENDLPAIEWEDGMDEWYWNGERHRDGGNPALVHPDGLKQWWLHGTKRKRPE